MSGEGTAFFKIQAEIGHALFFVGSVAGKATVREDGPDLAVEIDGRNGLQEIPGEQRQSSDGEERPEHEWIPECSLL